MERWPSTMTAVLASICGVFASILTYGAFLLANFAIYLASSEPESASALLGQAPEWVPLVAGLGVGIGAAGLVYRATRRTWGGWAIVVGAGSVGWLVGVIVTEALASYFAIVGGVLGASLMASLASLLLSRSRLSGCAKDATGVAS